MRTAPVYLVSGPSVFWGGVAIAVASALQTLFYVAWWS